MGSRLPNELLVTVITFYRRPFYWWLNPYGKDIEQRAEAALTRLSVPTNTLRYQLVMADMCWSDLMREEAALLEKPLELQAKVLELSLSEVWAKRAASDFIYYAPIPRLFAGICRQALTNKASAIRITFAEPDCRVEFREQGSWREVMTMPALLGPPLRGHMRLQERAGLEPFKPFIHEDLHRLRRIDFTWHDDQVELALVG